MTGYRMKSLQDYMDNRYKIGEKFRLAWYFNGWWEKLILILSMFSLFYSIVRVIFQGFW